LVPVALGVLQLEFILVLVLQGLLAGGLLPAGRQKQIDPIIDFGVLEEQDHTNRKAVHLELLPLGLLDIVRNDQRLLLLFGVAVLPRSFWRLCQFILAAVSTKL